ncbi:MAG: aspartate--tRNA(Asn) ligase [Candidatus Pacebacteria bacterium]|nr:aspartate--tRNA(Asn) ligase [Candidatus Paceibacterota bacterium]
MKRTMIKSLSEKKGQEVKIKGWVDTVRFQGKMAFFDFRDVSGKVQGIIFGKPEVLESAKELRAEWVVELDGIINERPEKNINKDILNGDVEIEITKIQILSGAEIPFDLNDELNLDISLDNRPYTLKSDKNKAIFKVQAEIVKAFRNTLGNFDFTEFQAPKIVGGDAEGGAEVYNIEYFKNTASLATSPQLYKQIMVGVFEKVYSIGNVFRAEKHSTSRHLNEYSSLDFEMGFIKDHTDIMDMLAEVMRGIKKGVEENTKDELKLLQAEELLIPDKIPTMKLSEAQVLLEEKLGFENAVGEPDLEPEHERALCDYAKKELKSDLIFVTHYPVSKRPFYTYEDEDEKGFTKSFDALFKGVEIVSGGQRRHDYDNLIEGLKMKGLNPDDFKFYLQAFKTGMPPHGGIGLGLERITQKILGLKNVKEASLFPREINRIDTLLSE